MRSDLNKQIAFFMSERFHPITITHLYRMITKELDTNNSVFGIPAGLFFKPQGKEAIRQKQFGKKMRTPIGVAAGPHTQMAHNIIVSWLMGASYIELKTIQTLDELEVNKPCIDMQDEGYNCEWSQELKIEQSFDEYLNAWIIIHLLNHRFGQDKDPGVIFNMSVGYDLKGIMQGNVQWFLDKMKQCPKELQTKIDELRPLYPSIDKVAIPHQLSDNITLSTMHGCPADEIESIARHLIRDKKLHTYVKLNPTLLGPERLREILNKKLGFKTEVPDKAFEHDLKYKDALTIIRSLQQTASEEKLEFGLKLTNTLETKNIKDVFGGDVDMMYMSGRALHPISVNVAARLQHDFEGTLHLSFSGGADAFNISTLLAAGIKTVTVSSDLLKPGGYMRLHQYIEELSATMKKEGAESFDTLIQSVSGCEEFQKGALNNLTDYADKVLTEKSYHRTGIAGPDIKTESNLDFFDCISAPCRETCATHQDIPEYLFFTSSGQFDKAYETILRTNPFPAITGMVCDHLCQNKCTRVNYDDPLLIREVKRFISEQDVVKLNPQNSNGIKAAIIGAGPAGLSCAYYLALAGFGVDVFEAKPKAGGMVEYAIPGFRLTDEAIQKDFQRLKDLGVNIQYNKKVDQDLFQKLQKSYSYIFAAPGAQKAAPLKLDGIDTSGVLDSLDFLYKAKAGEPSGIGKHVVIIGGGNTAMDAARTAYRLVGSEGSVTIVYRRTIQEMPADQGEIKAVLEEGISIMELSGPERIVSENSKVHTLVCSKMALKEADGSGRPRPQKIEGSEFEISCDTIIPAVGQALDIDFTEADKLDADTASYETKIQNVFTGGDALRGASTAINAIGDGRKTAEKIMAQAGVDFGIPLPNSQKDHSYHELTLKRAKRVFAPKPEELPLDDRKNFRLVQNTLDRESIVKEAGRCLHCDEICNICTTVCPNFANFAYRTEPVSIPMQKAVRTNDNQVVFEEDGCFNLRQNVQILNIANFCNECGNCNTFCPTSSAPYKDKPKLHLTLESFKADKDGYFLARLDDRKNLIFKHDGHIKTFSETADSFIYETEFVKASFSKPDFQIMEAQLLTPCIKVASFHEAAIMKTILTGAARILSEK